MTEEERKHIQRIREEQKRDRRIILKYDIAIAISAIAITIAIVTIVLEYISVQ